MSKVNTNPPEEVQLTGIKAVDVYDRIAVEDFVSGTDISLLNGDTFIDTSKTGKAEAEVLFKYEGVVYSQRLSFTVEDQEPPLLLKSGSGTVIETGTKFELNDYVGYADNYDRKPKLTYTGTVDTSVPGKYPLTATVTDSSGNETSWELTISVVDEIQGSEDNEEPVPFEEFADKYGGEDTRLGIDVSRWQGDIDFEAVKAAGCEFVIMRIGSYFDEYTLDSCYKANIAGAKAAGLDVGVYIYTTANSAGKAKDNAKWIAEQIGGEKLDMPVVFDWENFYEFQSFGMNIHDLNEYFQIFAKEMKSYGYDAMLYSSKNFLNDFWEEQTDIPVWLAHYTDATDYTGRYDLWQMTSHGSIPGIDGNVDFDILYK